MKSPTQILRKEHDVVLDLLDNLEKSIDKKDLKLSGKTIITLEKEFEKHSLNKEEKILFPEIEKFIPRDGGPTGVMILEHEDLVKSINEFKKNKQDSTGYHIISLLRDHINKENTMLFMIADMHLDEKQNRIILDKFDKIK